MHTLNDLLKAGQRGLILDVTGDDAVSVRLMEMGLTEGADIELIGFAPLGDPVEFRIRGYRLPLRKAEASRVTIDLL